MDTGNRLKHAKLEDAIYQFMLHFETLRTAEPLRSEGISMLCSADKKGLPLCDLAWAVFEDWGKRSGIDPQVIVDRAESQARARRGYRLVVIHFIDFDNGDVLPFGTRKAAAEYLRHNLYAYTDAVIETVQDSAGHLKAERFDADDWMAKYGQL